jgi:hypothetical protein
MPQERPNGKRERQRRGQERLPLRNSSNLQDDLLCHSTLFRSKKKEARTCSVSSVGHVQRRHAHQQADHARTVTARIPLSKYDSTGSADANYFHLTKQARYRLLAYGSFIFFLRRKKSRSIVSVVSSSDRVPKVNNASCRQLDNGCLDLTPSNPRQQKKKIEGV